MTFGYRATGTLNPPHPQTGLIAIVGKQTFDGSGALSFTQTVSFNGAIFPLNAAGAYQVNADCTGTMNLNITGRAPAVLLKLWIVVVNGGKEIHTVVMTPTPNGTPTPAVSFTTSHGTRIGAANDASRSARLVGPAAQQ